MHVFAVREMKIELDSITSFQNDNSIFVVVRIYKLPPFARKSRRRFSYLQNLIFIFVFLEITVDKNAFLRYNI